MNTKVYIETFGCQMNVADSERAATALRLNGYDLTTSEEQADVVLFNTCSVRERAERKVYKRITDLRHLPSERRPLIGVMGCVAQLEGSAIWDTAPDVNMIIGTRATDRISSLIERLRGGEDTVIDVGERAEGESWDVSPVERHSPYVAYVPIIEGCNKFCSFCIVPYSRGREQSRSASEIIAEVNRLRLLGYKEVHLIGQNVNSYRPRSAAGLENSRGATPFCRLLRAVAETGVERIKFTTSFPRDFHPDIVAALEEYPNLCDWIHLPVQSGSDNILKAMRRGHKAEDYFRSVDAIKNSKRRLSLTSDIIVGFPGETDEDFQDSMSLVERCEYDGLFIFKYSKRSGTPAAKLTNSVSEDTKKERFLTIEARQHQLQNKVYQRYIGRTVSVMVEGESARSDQDMTGHSSCHKVVNFKGSLQKGDLVDVKITEAKSYSLYGEQIN
ncbi:MAG: tRNA (N6-isopentenyl adenosine(37)-C2)-methylthiotransferase MiaB [bacterium]